MDPATIAITAIITLFFLLLGVKDTLDSRYSEKLCALCLAVSMTWAGLLIVYWIGAFHDTALLGLLMGSTVLGLFYTFEDRLDGAVELFRLPVYLTLLTAAYTLLTVTVNIALVAAIALLWTGFGLLYLYREDEHVHDHVRRIIACCKDW